MSHIAFHDWIFDEALFKQEVQLFQLDLVAQKRAERALERFQRAWRLGRLRRAGAIEVTELRAQQAFNQLVFHELLGFTDMMTDEATYSLLPEVSFALELDDERTARPRTDLAFGDFSSTDSRVAGVTELKSPGASLSKGQQGKAYRSHVTGEQLSAVEQALEAMTAAECEWALASNLKEVCLIHESNPRHALAFDLSTLEPERLRDFYFAFGPGGFYTARDRRSRLRRVHDRARRLAT